MQLLDLNLQNFRSYSNSSINFSPNTTLIVGPNTAGKTNILEAIFLLATGKSFHAEKDMEMIRFGEKIARVKTDGLEIVLMPQKRYLVNGVSKRQMDFIGNIRAVLFAPTDLELITDSPSLRRKYLDFVLIQVDREYRRALSLYEKGVRQRNKLLERIRDEGIPHSQLYFWDDLLIKNGQIITLKRQEYINYINYQPSDLGVFSVVYDRSEMSRERLDQYTREEVSAATTLVGPHRDDFKILKGEDKDISLYGSRGEQRMAILWLKMAELEFITSKTGSRPLLLLDDIFSELDKAHRNHIMEIIPKQQTIITTTDLEELDKEVLNKVKIIEL